MSSLLYHSYAHQCSSDFIGSGVSVMVVESVLDGSLTRFALVVTTPFLFCISLVSHIFPFVDLETDGPPQSSSSVLSSLVISAWCKTNIDPTFGVLCLSQRCRIGPVAQFHQNSKYYSAIPPAPNKAVDSNLPHVTIQMPVYKESLKETMCVDGYLMRQHPLTVI